ncbi:hypothetical protein EXIGLDRAFT_441638 [Exidia glandulosa HHB12029]|uniref:Uncharacterized protein n=1 Tax=Exidia glandulosa HHB12029 TaxID=1314781 RepID=A0A165KB42_EXIGL|nr:hypothetical protein EXIGLDRAFT_441638 [Exidia glandulosa HHB12029]
MHRPRFLGNCRIRVRSLIYEATCWDGSLVISRAYFLPFPFEVVRPAPHGQGAEAAAYLHRVRRVSR